MAWYDPRHIFTFSRRRKIPIVVNGEINPGLLTIARRSHWIQSRVLRISDRFGFFSSGPPLLQAYQAQSFATIATEAVGPTISVSITEWLGLGFDTSGWLPTFMAVVSLLFAISTYVQEVFFNPKRSPNYNWEALSKKVGLMDMPA